MTVYTYIARSRGGERTEGTIEANDRSAALRQIEGQGVIPVSVQEQENGKSKKRKTKKSGAKGGSGPRRRRARMKGAKLLNFTTELSDLLAAGMRLGQALNILVTRTSSGEADPIVEQLRDDIVNGSSLSDSAAKHGAFPTLYCSMLRAGEASGDLAGILKRLVIHYERLQNVKDKVVMALVYPGIVLTMGIGTMIFVVSFVIPKFSTIFNELQGTLPLPTRIMIDASNFIVRYGVFIAIAVVIAVIMFIRAVRTERGRLWWDGLMLRMPLIKGIVSSNQYAQFAQTLGTLLRNGVPVLQALSIVENSLSNKVLAREINNARERVTDGTAISGPLADGKIFPEMMTDMLAIGEQTGDMSGSLEHIARRYENQLDRNVTIFTTALEPILIVVIAVLVGFVAMSMLFAVFELTSGIEA